MKLSNKLSVSSSMADTRMLTALSTTQWPRILDLDASKSSQSNYYLPFSYSQLPIFALVVQDSRKLRTSSFPLSGIYLNLPLMNLKSAVKKTWFLNRTSSASKRDYIRHLAVSSLPRTKLTLAIRPWSTWLREFTLSALSLDLSRIECAHRTITWVSCSRSRVKFKKQRLSSQKSFKFGTSLFLRMTLTRCRSTLTPRLSLSTTRKQISTCAICWFSSKWSLVNTIQSQLSVISLMVLCLWRSVMICKATSQLSLLTRSLPTIWENSTIRPKRSRTLCTRLKQDLNWTNRSSD